MDSSTDAGHIEQESSIIFPERWLDKKNKVMFTMITPERANTDGLLKCLTKSLEPFEINDVLNKENVAEDQF